MSKRFNFLGTSISVINPGEARNQVLAYPYLQPGYVCFPDASVVKDATQDALLTTILNNSYLTMPDGKPSQIAARLQGHHEVTTVSGFYLCQSLLNTKLTHFFYGGDEASLRNIRNAIETSYPDAKVLGYKAPPFVTLNEIQANPLIKQDFEAINKLQPDIIWIGISSPKQDYLMHFHHKQLDKSLLMGIGGAMLYFSDSTLKSPEWIKKIGMRWAYRLAKEPGRLGKKYSSTFRFLLSNTPFFVKCMFHKKNSSLKINVR